MAISIFLRHAVAACMLLLATASVSLALDEGIPCTAGFAGPYPCDNVDLLAFVPTNALVGASTGSDVWGWTDPETGREYAIQALSNATAFVDITEPTQPVYLGHLPAPVTNFLWRDVKVYRNHAYIVGDFSPFAPDGDAVHGLQIFDLTRLRDAEPLTIFSETSRYNGFDEAHNIVINEETGFAYAVSSGTCGNGMHILDLEPNPADPTFVGCFDDGGLSTHDAQCVVYRGPDRSRQGNEICFNSNGTELTIADLTDKQNPEVLARVTYEGMGFVHQNWLTEDHRFLAVGDELDELNAATAGQPHNTHTYLFDVADLGNPVQLPTYVGPTAAIDHNLYINGRFMFQANYAAGLSVLDTAEIASGSLKEIAFFDTHPASNVTAFAGSWSSYPFFESGVVVVSDIEDGLYILRPHLPAHEGGQLGDKATGGGWLAARDGGRINFGFEAEQTADGPDGSLNLHDRTADVRVQITEVTAVGPVQGQCGSIGAAENALEFTGLGTFNRDQAASFRVCVVDNGEPGNSRAGDDPDRFHLTCLAGCSYATGDRVELETIDGGNIGVRRGSPDSGGEDDSAPATLMLTPLALEEADAGSVELFRVRAWDSRQQAAAGAVIELSVIGAGGLLGQLSARTDKAGNAAFEVSLPLGANEFQVTAGEAESNIVTVETAGLLR